MCPRAALARGREAEHVSSAVTYAVLALLACGFLAWAARHARNARRAAASAWPAPRHTRRHDERDHVLARYYLRPGMPEYAAHYARRPDHEAPDTEIKNAPGIHSPQSALYDAVMTAADKATFTVTHLLQSAVELPPAPIQQHVAPGEITEFLTQWAKRLGAHSSGVTELRDYHLYTNTGYAFENGRPLPWGSEIDNRHRFAFVFTVEMEQEWTEMAPTPPASVEAAQQYLRGAVIALQLASFIQRLGYPARAHIYGNCQVQCTTLAKDAGLGEIGRMGLLMTPALGPRVRIAAVTTDLPLVANPAMHDTAVLQLCSLCNKCATACPAKAIPAEAAREYDNDGVVRWRIDSEACFKYWNTAGTYCGRCLAVCPLSHPGNLFGVHALARFRGAAWFQRLTLAHDSYRHGEKPRPRRWRAWMRLRKAP
jgi:ferredoxin